MTSSLEIKHGSAAMHEELSERARLIEVLEFAKKLKCIHYSVHLVNSNFCLYLGPQDTSAMLLFAHSRYIPAERDIRSGDVVLHLKYYHDFLRD